MRLKGVFLIACVFIQAVSFAGPLLKAGTTIPVIFLAEVNTKQPSEPIIQVAEDILDAKGNIVIKKNTLVSFNYTISAPKRVGKPGMITVSFSSVSSVNGITIPLTGQMVMTGDNSKKMVLGLGLGLGLTIAPPMLLFLLKKGGHVYIPVNAKSITPKIAPNEFER